MQPGAPGDDPYGQSSPPPASPYGTPGSAPQQPSNGLGLASMIVGIVSIPLICCLGIGIVGGIVAVVLGFLGKQKADQGAATNRGQALAGIICGAIAAVLGILWLVLVVMFRTIDLDLPTA